MVQWRSEGALVQLVLVIVPVLVTVSVPVAVAVHCSHVGTSQFFTGKAVLAGHVDNGDGRDGQQQNRRAL